MKMFGGIVNWKDCNRSGKPAGDRMNSLSIHIFANSGCTPSKA